MTSFSKLWNPFILDSYDFSRFRTIADVGGGHGNFLVSPLEPHPSLSCILYDYPAVIEGARSAHAGTSVRATVAVTRG